MALRDRQLPITSRGGGRSGCRGAFPSIKAGKMVNFFSLVERDLCFELDFDPAVLSFEAQPHSIEYVHEGKRRSYTPDYRVVYLDRPPAILEAKPAHKVDTAENQMKFAAARAWCAANQHTFQVITDQTLRAGWRLRNIRFLTQYARHTIQPAHRHWLINTLYDAAMTISVAELARMVDPARLDDRIIDIFHLAFYHEILIDIDAGPISVDTIIQLPE